MTDRLFKSANSFIFGPQEERGHYQWWRQSIKLIHFWSNKYGTAHRAERERYQDVMTLTRVEASSAAHLLVLSSNKKTEKNFHFSREVTVNSYYSIAVNNNDFHYSFYLILYVLHTESMVRIPGNCVAQHRLRAFSFKQEQPVWYNEWRCHTGIWSF